METTPSQIMMMFLAEIPYELFSRARIGYSNVVGAMRLRVK